VTLGWTEINESLASPRGVDIAINNECGVISSQASNAGIVYYYGINPFDNGFALMVRPGGALRPLSSFLERGLSRPEAVRATAAQLRGRTVITTSNTDMEQGVAAATTAAGLRFGEDVRIINLPPEEGLAAFLSGQGDAFIGGIPQRLAARRAGMIELLTGVDLGPAPINGFVTTQRFLRAHPDALPKVLRVWFRIVQYTNQHKPEIAALVSRLLAQEGVTISADDFIANWNTVESFPATPQEAAANILSPSGRNYWRRRWDDCNRYYFQTVHTIPRPVDPQGVFLMESAQPAIVREVARPVLAPH
jgi:ABC-type nitrate/sulfonate/bicarbonate transport system substrate-binding protein